MALRLPSEGGAPLTLGYGRQTPTEIAEKSQLTIDPDAFGADREAVRLALEAVNIEARPVWKPMHKQ